MKILHLRNCRGITTLTGPETYLIDLLDLIDRSRFDIIFAFTEDSKSPASLFIKQLTNRKIPFKAIPISGRFQLKDLRYLIHHIKTEKIDLLHTHDARSNVIGLIASKFTHTPLISFAHGWVNWEKRFSKDWLYARLESLAVSCANYIFVASMNMMADLKSKRIPLSKIHHVPHGINTKKFQVIPNYKTIRNEFQIEKHTPLIGTVGRIHPWKGHRYFIEAAALVHRIYPEAKFLIVGDVAYSGHDQYKKHLIDLRNHLNLENSIIFTGSRDDIPSIMSAMDVFVLPSLIEPFGIVSLEAQACGVPVVATNVGGIPETLSGGHTGLLVKPKDSEALANAVLTILKDKTRANAMGQAGRLRIKRFFSAETMTKKTESVYLSIISK